MIEQQFTDDATGEKIPRVFLNSDGGYSAMSWNGFNVLGNTASIAEVKKAQYAQQYVEGLRGEIASLRATSAVPTSTLPCAHGVSFGLVCADCSPEHHKALTDLHEAKRLMTLLLVNGHHFSTGLQQEAQQFLNPTRYPKKPVEPGSVLAQLITESLQR